jgi:malate dehydrogenase (oxaloacetate-decarboxylating)
MYATTISDEMALAAARELACCAEERGLTDDAILPHMDDVRMVTRVAAATAFQAQKQGLARVVRTHEEYTELASRRILHSRHLSRILTRDALAREH